MLRTTPLVLLLALATASAAVAQTPAADAAWPSRQIKFIVPYQAGSSSDAVARIVGQRLSERLGQGLVIENRVGASGNLGSEAIARSDPDGYTIGLATTSTHAVAPTISPNLKYDPIKDFAAVSMLGSSPLVFVIYPGLPARDFKELLALAKAKPRSLNYATSGPASMGHLSVALLEKLAQIEMVHVPYRGTAQSVVDLISGRIEMVSATIPPSLQLINEGKIRAVATTGAARNSALANVPTVAEMGVSGYDCALWQALVMPAATPAAIVEKLSVETGHVLRSPAMKELLNAQGVDAEPSTPEELRARITADIVKWREVIRGANIAAVP